MSNPFSAESGSLSLPATVPNRRPFGGKRRLHNVVRLRFKASFVGHWYDAGELELHAGQSVIAETSRGPAVGLIVGEVQRRVVPMGSLKPVLRVASEQDMSISASNALDERTAFRLALGCVRQRNLSMKLVQVHYMHDRSKAIFYFSAEGRIDFRGLVKDLAAELRMRIEMRQIGARDGARMIGGIGPCGRELCCSTFLENFSPVSIRMAKDQGLTLNPKKVSGMCGRLMCCLVYEQQVYASARRRLPRHGKPVATALGLGTIKSVDVLQETVAVYLDEGKLETFAVADVVVLSPKQVEKRRELAKTAKEAGKRTGRRGGAGEDEYLWADGPDKGGGRRRRGRSGRSEKPEGSGKERSRRGKPERGGNRGGSPDRPAKAGSERSGRSRRDGAKRQDRRPPSDKAAGPEVAAAAGAEGAAPRKRRRRRGGRNADGAPAGAEGGRPQKDRVPSEGKSGEPSEPRPPRRPRPAAEGSGQEGSAPKGDGQAPRKRRRRRRRRKPEGGAPPEGGGGGEKS